MQFLRSVAIFTFLFSTAIVNALPAAAPLLVCPQHASCDLSAAVLQTYNGTATLSIPDPGLTLARVVLGRGTQNYTCADSTDKTVPVSTGAVANLYDVSYLASNSGTLLHKLPCEFVGISQSQTLERLRKFSRGIAQVGEHYFAPNSSIPVFDFRNHGEKSIFTGVKKESIIAPALSCPNAHAGAVNWLSLKTLPEKTVGYKLAYRVHTAGGVAPPTCCDQPASFEIQYAAEYWFYD